MYGDWALASDQWIWYKSEQAGGWIKHFQLGQPSVTEVDAADYAKKMIRQNRAWVELPIDEIVGSTDGVYYVRKKAATGEGTEWVALDLSTYVVQSPDDAKLYGMKGRAWTEIVFPAPGIADAPNNTNTYGRKGQAWVVIPAPLADAPSDTKLYGRADGAWKEVVIPSAGIADAPSNANTYARKGGAWVISTNVPVAPADATKLYGLLNNVWTEVPAAGIADAPTDGKQYGRVSGAWAEIVVPAGLADAPNNTNTYARKGGAWIISTNAPVVPTDAKLYGMKSGAWTEVVIPAAGISDAPNDAKTYARKGQAWIEIIVPTSAPSDGKTYVQKGGAWVSFDRYDLALATKTGGASITIDSAVDQCMEIPAAAGARTIAINAYPVVGRTVTLVLYVYGSTPVTFTGAKVHWNKDVAPEWASTDKDCTIITLAWTGKVWMAAQGSTTIGQV